MAYKFVNADQLDSDLTAVGEAIRAKGGTSAKLSFPSGMVSAIGAISTGVELNFDVVPGLTQPGTAADNTIWVKTEKIGAWYFSTTQPDGMQKWDVWFQTGTTSKVEFNALKKNGIQVYLLGAKQYVNGALTDVPCFIYLGGEWKDLVSNLYVYNAGDQCNDVTGGWTKVEGGAEKVSFDNKKITFTYGSGSGRSAAAYTVNKIDVSKYKTMVVTGKIIKSDVSEDNQSLVFGLTTSKTASTPSDWSSSKIYNTKGEFEETLDISNANSSYYVCLYAHGSNVEVYTVLLK